MSCFRSIDVLQAGGGQGLAHLVHVQAQHAAGELVALVAFVGLALERGLQRGGGLGARHADHAVV
eukprot:2013-Eustigmatos_ZCMA.PRE.1